MTALDVISVDEAKLYMRIDADYNFDDDVIETIIKASISQLEKEIALLLYQRNVTFNYRRPCCGQRVCDPIALPYVPVNGAVVLKDLQNNTVEFDNVGNAEYPAYNFTYSVDATFAAGYAEGELPDNLRLALLQRIATAYENREDTTSSIVNKVDNSSLKLAWQSSRNVF